MAARIIFPEDFPTQLALAKTLKAKHDLDALTSVLLPYLAEHGIDLDDLIDDGTAAEVHENSRTALRRSSEKNREKRDLAFSLPFKATQRSTQFLKGLYKPEYHKLGDWFITVNGVKRVVYPPKFIDRKQLVTDFFTKHNNYAAGTSPLQPFVTEQQLVPTDLLTAVTNAVTFDGDFTADSEASESQEVLRRNLWNPRWAEIKGIADYLMNLFVTNPKALGDWGFTVDDSPRKPKVRKSKILLSETKTYSNIVIGSTFINIGETTLHLYRGSATAPVPIVVLPGEKYGIKKGFNTITVTNASNLETGIFTTLIHR